MSRLRISWGIHWMALGFGIWDSFWCYFLACFPGCIQTGATFYFTVYSVHFLGLQLGRLGTQDYGRPAIRGDMDNTRIPHQSLSNIPSYLHMCNAASLTGAEYMCMYSTYPVPYAPFGPVI